MSTKVKIIIPWMADLAVNYSPFIEQNTKTGKNENLTEWWGRARPLGKQAHTWRDIVRTTTLEELCMVILLCNNHCELRFPLLIQEFTCLTVRSI